MNAYICDRTLNENQPSLHWNSKFTLLCHAVHSVGIHAWPVSLLLYKLVYVYILHTIKVMYDAIVPMKGTNQMLVHGIATIASMNISPWLLHSMELALGCVLCCTLNWPLIIMLFPFATLPASPHLPSLLHLSHSLLNYATVAQTHIAKTWNPPISYLQGWLYNSFSANAIQLCNWVTLVTGIRCR